MEGIVSQRAWLAALAFLAAFGFAFFSRGYPWHMASVVAMASGVLVYSTVGAVSRLQRSARPSHQLRRDRDPKA